MAKSEKTPALYDPGLEWELIVDLADGRVGVDEALDAGITADHFGAPHSSLVWAAAVDYRLHDDGDKRFQSAFRLSQVLATKGMTTEADLLRKACNHNALGRDLIDGFGGQAPQGLDPDRIERLQQWRDVRRLNSIAAGIYEGINLFQPPHVIMEVLHHRLSLVGTIEEPQQGRAVAEVVDERLSAYETAAITVPTGITDVDRMLNGGMRPGQLLILGARPSVGKSALALNIARAVARSGQHALFVSLEMGEGELVDRLVAAESRVSLSMLQAGNIGQRMMGRVQTALPRVRSLPITIDTTATTVIGVRRAAERVQRRHGLGLVVVDYLQLLDTDGKSSDNRANDVAQMSRGLKLLARQLGVPMLALSQLSRNIEYRSGKKRPQLSDLRESGGLEQDADVVMFLSRDHDAAGTVDVTVAKHRNGPLGEARLAWLAETMEYAGLATGGGFR